MLVGSIFSNALSGLHASQSAMGVISQNVANANTPGYVRAQANFTPQVVAGGGAGVQVESVTRAADRFLAAAQRVAGAASSAAGARAELLDRAQLFFGDPNGTQTVFSRIDDLYTSLQTAATSPQSGAARRSVIGALQETFSEFSRVAQSIEELRLETDQRISAAVTRADGLLQRIADLNGEVALTRKSGGDSSGAENARDQLIDEVSTLLDVRTTAHADGVLELRTNSGGLLVGTTAARLSYTQNATTYGPPGSIIINEGLPTEGQFGPMLSGGLIKGLMQVRDVDLPGLAESVGALSSALADELNRAHATNAADPPASHLVGRNTGLLAADALNFTGQTVVGIVDSTGALTRRMTIDFDAGTITTENPADTRSFTQTVGGFTTTLNAVLQLAPAAGTASFANGVMTLDGSSGLVLGEVDGDPSARAGRSFAHFFGLNDVVRSDKPIFTAAGVSASDAHGLAGGGAVRFQVTDAAGRVVLERNVTVTGTTWADYIAQMNSTTNGFGQYGVASLDGSGAIVIAPGSGYAINAISDTTQRGATTLGVTDMFGLSRSSLAALPHDLAVDARIVAAPSLLALGKPDLTAGIGTRIAESGDARGAQSLVDTRSTQRAFKATGALSAQTASISAYTSRLAAEAARLADNAARSEAGATAVLGAATERRTQAEGVSLDEELVRMTQFQQSYAAASRLIQAAQEMLDTLLAIT